MGFADGFLPCVVLFLIVVYSDDGLVSFVAVGLGFSLLVFSTWFVSLSSGSLK